MTHLCRFIYCITLIRPKRWRSSLWMIFNVFTWLHCISSDASASWRHLHIHRFRNSNELEGGDSHQSIRSEEKCDIKLCFRRNYINTYWNNSGLGSLPSRQIDFFFFFPVLGFRTESQKYRAAASQLLCVSQRSSGRLNGWCSVQRDSEPIKDRNQRSFRAAAQVWHSQPIEDRDERTLAASYTKDHKLQHSVFYPRHQ